MKKVLKINSEGFFIEDVLIENNETLPNNCIETICPQGFKKPKWDGKEWVEGDVTKVKIETDEERKKDMIVFQ